MGIFSFNVGSSNINIFSIDANHFKTVLFFAKCIPNNLFCISLDTSSMS